MNKYITHQQQQDITNYLKALESRDSFKYWLEDNNLKLDHILYDLMQGKLDIIHLWDAFHGKQNRLNIARNIVLERYKNILA